MKKFSSMIFLWAAALGAVQAETSVGISIGINQPGIYGRINIGDVPPVALVLPEPVIITQPTVRVERSPIYLYVPESHQQQWARYCSRYGACGQPVYFVHDHWVRERYEHEHPGRKNKHGNKNKKDKHRHGEGKHGKGHGHAD